MAAYIYAGNQYHALGGNKIVKDGVLLDLKATDKIVANGTAYNLGAATVPSGGTAPEITFENGTEPAGTKRYITPEGCGDMDGSSWSNAASGAMLHAIMLQCASGDSVYFSEGEYTLDRTITLPSGVSLYGGFAAETPAWSTRNGFTHVSRFTPEGSVNFLSGSASAAGQKADGFTLDGFSGIVQSSIADNIILRNSTVNNGTATLTNACDCVFISVTAIVANAEKCNFFYGSCSVTVSANYVNVYGTEEHKAVCKILGTATNCSAVNCENFTSSDSIFKASGGDGGGNAAITNCNAVNCSSSSNVFYASGGYGGYNSDSDGGNAAVTNCNAVNCLSSSSIFYGSGGNGKGSAAGNSVSIGGDGGNAAVTNCNAVNCSSSSNIFYGTNGNNGTSYGGYGGTSSIKNCNSVNCLCASVFYSASKNCLSWNNTGTEFGSTATTCAGSVYNEALALTLGTDNSIARFKNTGFAPARGVQDAGDCPSPLTDPEGYAEWLSAFGDWRPAANSFLKGAGTADANVTSDLAGTTRPSPPTIGAYEAETTLT